MTANLRAVLARGDDVSVGLLRRLNRASSALFGGQFVPDVEAAQIKQRVEALATLAEGAAEAALVARQAAAAADETRRLLADPYWAYQPQRRTFDWMAPSGATDLQAKIVAMLRRLRPHKAVGVSKIRLGSPHDGGYIMLDDFSGVTAALSFGVEHNADWDLAVAERVGRVLQFDHTIDAAPLSDARLIWAKKKIAAQPSGSEESIVSILNRLPRSNDADLILKMDIEHDEWPLFEATPPECLSRFRQITGEFHGFDFLADREYLARMARVFEKLSHTHAVVHIHANNYCGAANIAGVVIPFILEITLANRSTYELVESDETFPGPLDAPCDPSRPDLVLGAFRF